jgi:hypothetical protein
MQLSVWQNRSLAFKILRFQKTPSYLRFEKVDFLYFQITIFKNAVSKRFMFCDLV